MSARTYVIVVIGALVASAMILRKVRDRRMRAKYALLWMAVCVTLVALAVIPGALDKLAELAGVAYPPALLLVAGLGFFALLCLHFSSELSRLEDRTRMLAEESALIWEQLDRLKRSGADPVDESEARAQVISPASSP